MLRIHSFETFWTNEWPGIRCIVFLQGCQFRCLYCHNPDTQSMEGGKFYSVEQICEKIERVRPYFGKFWGVTISGWEPLLQAKALIPLFVELKKRWIHTTLDTNGYPWNGDVEVLVRDYTDLVLLDIKEINQDDIRYWHDSLIWKFSSSHIGFRKYKNQLGFDMYSFLDILIPWKISKNLVVRLAYTRILNPLIYSHTIRSGRINMLN